MPLKQRVPKLKGFNNPFRVEYSPVNLHQLEKLGASTVDVDALVAAGLVRKGAFVKVLGYGDLSIKVSLSVHAISAAARSAVEAAGGDVTIVPLPHEGEGKAGRPAVKGNQFANR
jgi:large subunit ribosomal protein L15